MEREKWIIRVAAFGLLAYAGYVLFMLINDGEKYWTSLIYPILLIIGLQRCNYTGWIILMTNLIVECLFYLFVVLKNFIYIWAQPMDASQENYLNIYHYLVAFSGLLLVAIYVWHQKKQFVREQKKYPGKFKKLCILLLALSIPFLPRIEPRLKLALDFYNIKVSNAEGAYTVQQVLFSSDNKIIAAIPGRTGVFVWNLEKRNSEILPAADNVCSMALTPNGNYLVIGRRLFREQGVVDTNDAGIEIWNRYTGEKFELKRNEPWVKEPTVAIQVSCSPDNIHFAVTRDQGGTIVEIWNIKTGTLDKTIPVEGASDISNRHPFVGTKIVYSPDGKTIAIEGDTVTIWDVNTGQCIAGLKSEGKSVKGNFACSPDGRYLASVMNEGATPKERGVIIWELVTQNMVTRLDWDLNMSIETVQYSSDGQYIAVGGGEYDKGIVKIWETTSGTLKKSMEYPYQTVDSVAFSMDGKKLAVAAGSHIKVWDWQ